MRTFPWRATSVHAPVTSFAGGSFGNLLGRDSVLSFRATMSPDNPATESFPRYRGAAVTYSVPAGKHGVLESSVQMVQTNQPVDPFTTGLTAYDGRVYGIWAETVPDESDPQSQPAAGAAPARTGPPATILRIGTADFRGVARPVKSARP